MLTPKMLTPKRYWRVAKTISELQVAPGKALTLPDCVAEQKKPPAIGDGILLADYDASVTTGLVRQLGIVRSGGGRNVTVEWMPSQHEIWVDTGPGRSFWSSKAGFCFAPAKVAGYGLHHLFADTFPGLEPRESLPQGARAIPRRTAIARERLEPMQVVGEPTDAPRGGYVYLLKSAYGYKVGRARSMPDRMRAFGVQLPFMYTIPLCAWFDDHYDAETRYHRLFADKHINGEWFDLGDPEIELIRQRTHSIGASGSA